MEWRSLCSVLLQWSVHVSWVRTLHAFDNNNNNNNNNNNRYLYSQPVGWMTLHNYILGDSAAQLNDLKHLPFHWLVWKFKCTLKIVQATTGKTFALHDGAVNMYFYWQLIKLQFIQLPLKRSVWAMGRGYFVFTLIPYYTHSRWGQEAVEPVAGVSQNIFKQFATHGLSPSCQGW